LIVEADCIPSNVNDFTSAVLRLADLTGENACQVAKLNDINSEEPKFQLPEWLRTDQAHLSDYSGSSKPVPNDNSLISVENPSVSTPIHSLYDDRSSILYDLRNTDYDSQKLPVLLQKAKEKYMSWVLPSTYLVFKKIEYLNNSEEKISTVAFLASKRGNSVYKRHMLTKVDRLEPYFKPTFLPINPKTASTNILFVTLTLNPRLFSPGIAWEYIIQKSYNRYISAIRSRYGKIAVVRCDQAQKNGYPHIHLILLFDHQIIIKKHQGADKSSWRLLSLSKKQHDFADLWRLPIYGKKNEYTSLGYVDVQGITTQRGAINYILRYALCEAGKNAEEDLSLAMSWIYRKRSFSVSTTDLIAICLTQSRLLVKINENAEDPSKTAYLTEFIYMGSLVVEYSDRSPPNYLDFQFNENLLKKVENILLMVETSAYQR